MGWNWSIEFKTYGAKPTMLNITGINGTEFDKDLDFVSLRCGNNEIIPIRNGNTYSTNWYCNDIGTFTSTPKTAGVHILEFKFGNDKAYAFNTAYHVFYDTNATWTGTFSNTTDLGANISLIANSSGLYENQTGTYLSKVFDANTTASWNNLSWKEKKVNRTQIFTSNDIWTVPAGVTSVEVLVVAGGGGGAVGGGGAGGLIYNASYSTTPSQNITVTVGDGGAGAGWGSQGTNGSNSVFDTNTAVGGGGGSHNTDGRAGGSGGGAGYGTYTGGTGTAGQGNAGADTVGHNDNPGGGGGGGGAVGGNTDEYVGGNGGVGLDYSTEFGTGVGESGWFAGGGGGSTFTGTPGTGGTGGGGNGVNGASAVGEAGTANTGGGGGAGVDSGGATGGAGGSGIVIIKYQIPITISAHDCNDASCSGEESTWDVNCTNATFCDLSAVSNDRYFQYKATFTTDLSNFTPALNNVSIYYNVTEAPPAVNITQTAVPVIMNIIKNWWT